MAKFLDRICDFLLSEPFCITVIIVVFGVALGMLLDIIFQYFRILGGE